MIKKIITFLIVTFVLFPTSGAIANSSVSVNKTENLNNALVDAEARFLIATETLRNLNTNAFYYFSSCPWGPEFQAAEKELRLKYPAAYSEYIDAKSNLEDLRYLNFVSMVDSIQSV